MQSNPAHAYRPVIIRVTDVLCSRADANGELEITNREIGRLVECSIGCLPAVLRQLEADGVIERRPGTRGTHIRVLMSAPVSPSLRIDPAIKQGTPRSQPRRTATRPETAGLLGQLRELEQMWKRGSLTDEEFQDFKQLLRQTVTKAPAQR